MKAIAPEVDLKFAVIKRNGSTDKEYIHKESDILHQEAFSKYINKHQKEKDIKELIQILIEEYKGLNPFTFQAAETDLGNLLLINLTNYESENPKHIFSLSITNDITEEQINKITSEDFNEYLNTFDNGYITYNYKNSYDSENQFIKKESEETFKKAILNILNSKSNKKKH